MDVGSIHGSNSDLLSSYQNDVNNERLVIMNAKDQKLSPELEAKYVKINGTAMNTVNQKKPGIK